MANYLDFLLALDAYTRASSLGYVSQGHEMHRIAYGAGLVPQADFKTAARWVGELVIGGTSTTALPRSATDIRSRPERSGRTSSFSG